MANFFLNSKFYYDEDSLSALESIDNERILVLLEHKYLKTYNNSIYPYLNSSDIKYIYFDDSHNHNLKNIKEEVYQAVKFDPKYIISIGSVSVINYAKIIRYYKNKTTNILENSYSIRDILINIPIPSAGGFESCNMAFIIDKENSIFEILQNEILIPDMVIINPILVDIYSIYDLQCMSFIAFCNAIGASDSMSFNEFSSMHANKSIQLIDKFILLLNNNENILSKTNTLQLGSLMSGIAVGLSDPNLIFLISFVLNKYFDLDLVSSYSILVPTVMTFNTHNKFLKTVYSNIANNLNFHYGSEDLNLRALIEYIKNISLNLDLPSSLEEAGIDYHQIIDNIDDIAEDICSNLEIINSSIQLSIEDIREILINII